ncbi:MAG: hypothetical protein HDS11_07335 [Bacteroides sp.]|nr:hypothetical protein [Bacteroides sp.]
MQKLWFNITALFLPLIAAAQEPALPDSISDAALDSIISLKEVNVEALMQRTDARMTQYAPTRRQKEAAQTALQLLSMMGIPQIQVNPSTGDVNALSGKELKIFINKLPATKEELAGVRTMDVKSVEYMEYPSDPRFRNAPAVINIVLAPYEWGGYTKISPNVTAGAGVNPHLQVYSKFAYKKMIYDINATGGFVTNNGGLGYDEISTFRLPDYQGNGPMEVTRKLIREDAKYRSNSESLNFRAVYQTETAQISNSVSLDFAHSPHSDVRFRLEYDNPLFDNGSRQSFASVKRNSVSWRGDYMWMLPKSWALFFAGGLAYSDNNNKQTSFDNDVLVINNPTDEKAWSYGGAVGLQKTFGEKHTLSAHIQVGEERNHVDYTGDADTEMDFQSLYYKGGVQYQFNTSKWSLTSFVSFGGNSSSVNHGKSSFIPKPLFELAGSYSPSSKHQISLDSYYEVMTPMSSLRNPTLVESDPFLWTMGNPDLKKSPVASISASYLWLPSNKWQLGIDASFRNTWNHWAVEYLPDGPGGTILSHRVNDGSYLSGFVGLSASLRLLNGSLQLVANPMLRVYAFNSNTTDCSLTSFGGSLNATYYIKQFYLQGYYGSRERSLTSNNGQRCVTKDYYGFKAGWSKSNLNVSVGVWNFARWSDRTAIYTLTTPYFDRSYLSLAGDSHAMVNLSLTYTISYGKKVSQSNETITSGSTTSAVLSN